jgi:hypothetical protein
MRKPSEYEAPLCSQVGGDHWFPEKDEQFPTPNDTNIAKRICHQCIHRNECAEWGIVNEYFGIWGGLTSYERKRIRRSRNIILRRDKSA